MVALAALPPALPARQHCRIKKLHPEVDAIVCLDIPPPVR